MDEPQATQEVSTPTALELVPMEVVNPHEATREQDVDKAHEEALLVNSALERTSKDPSILNEKTAEQMDTIVGKIREIDAREKVQSPAENAKEVAEPATPAPQLEQEPVPVVFVMESGKQIASTEEARAMYDQLGNAEVNRFNEAMEYVTIEPDKWGFTATPEGVSLNDPRKFEYALDQKHQNNVKSQKNIFKAGFLAGGSTMTAGIATIAIQGAGAPALITLASGVGITAGGVVFAATIPLIALGGIGYLGKKIYDRAQENKARKNFETATKASRESSKLLSWIKNKK